MNDNGGLTKLSTRIVRHETMPIFAGIGISGVEKIGVAMKIAPILAMTRVKAINQGPTTAEIP